MLKCSELARIASDYIDGELGTRRNLSVKTHLMMCKHCRTFIGNLRASNELLGSYIGESSTEIANKFMIMW